MARVAEAGYHPSPSTIRASSFSLNVCCIAGNTSGRGGGGGGGGGGRGTVKVWKNSFGFIGRDDGKPDLFFHVTDVQNQSAIAVGAKAEWVSEGVDAKGRKEAKQVRVLAAEAEPVKKLLIMGECAPASPSEPSACTASPLRSSTSETTPRAAGPAWARAR